MKSENNELFILLVNIWLQQEKAHKGYPCTFSDDFRNPIFPQIPEKKLKCLWPSF